MCPKNLVDFEISRQIIHICAIRWSNILWFDEIFKLNFVQFRYFCFSARTEFLIFNFLTIKKSSLVSNVIHGIISLKFIAYYQIYYYSNLNIATNNLVQNIDRFFGIRIHFSFLRMARDTMYITSKHVDSHAYRSM